MNHESYCFCHTCNRNIHYMGIARHRAMHRDRKEDCDISYARYRCTHEYSKTQDRRIQQ